MCYVKPMLEHICCALIINRVNRDQKALSCGLNRSRAVCPGGMCPWRFHIYYCLRKRDGYRLQALQGSLTIDGNREGRPPPVLWDRNNSFYFVDLKKNPPF